MYLTLLRAATSSRVTDADIERWRKAQETLGIGTNRYLDMLLRGSILPHREWLRLNNERHGLRRTFAAFFEDYDVLLCPVGASAAPPHNPRRRDLATHHHGEREIPAIDEPSVLGGIRDPRFSPRNDGPAREPSGRDCPSATRR